MTKAQHFFDLFELEMALPVDVKKLSDTYKQLQKKYHPDNFVHLNESDKLKAMQFSADINEGYSTLKDHIKAAEYFVRLNGIDINAEQDTIRDLDFLDEQFELRERLDELSDSSDFMKLDAFFDEVISKKDHIYAQLLNEITNKEFELAKISLYKLRYFSRLLEQIEQIQESI